MSKKVTIMLILLSFLLLFGLDSAYAVNGACLNPNSIYFCSPTQVSDVNCCGLNNPQCLANQFIPNTDSSATGYCLGSGTGCCRDSCTSAQISGIMTPLTCTDRSKFTAAICDDYSECRKGCYFCTGDSSARGYAALQFARTDCVGIGKTLTFFNSTASESQCSALPPPAVQLFSFSGNVKNSDDSSDVSGATVIVAGITGMTDANGAFSFQNIPKGNYTVTAYKDGFFENLSKLNIAQDTSGFISIIKPSPTAELIVRVQDSAGIPVENAAVSVSGFAQNTDSAGQTSFASLFTNNTNSLPKIYSVTATANGLSASTTTKLTSPQTTITLTLLTAAETNANVSGYVSGPDVNGNSVMLSNVAVAIGGKAYATESNGFYKIENIAAGTYTAYITPPSPYLPKQQIVDIAPGQNSYDFTVQRGGAGNTANITIVVKDGAGDFEQGASVSIKQAGSALPSFDGTTDASGVIAASNLQKTTYEITISKIGFGTITQAIAVSQDETFTFVITPVSLIGRRVSGHIINSTSQIGMPQATVYLDELRWTMSDQDGYYQFDFVNEGVHIVKAEKSGYLSDSAAISVTADTEKNLTLGIAGCVGALGNPNITSLSLNRSAVIVKFRAACEASGSYVYRCEGTVCIPVAITNILSTGVIEYADSDIKPNTLYWYEVHTMHERPFVQEKVSSRQSIFAGLPQCFDAEGEFCFENKRTICNESNYMVNIGAIPTDPLCMPKDTNTTEYVSKLNCSIHCNKPLGMFSVAGEFPLSVIGGNVNAECSSTDFSSYPALKSCYKDFETTAVDRYFSCENVKSCYDYRSEGSCEENRCAKQMNCEWRPYLQDLSLGVCMPVEQKYQNCSRCDVNDKYNNLFGKCDKEICDLYGGNTSTDTHLCYFDDGQCKDRNLLSCQHYGANNEECAGDSNTEVNVDVSATNEILTKSDDLLGFGLCKYGMHPSLGNNARCFKDANDDSVPDTPPTDMTPPETVIIHPTASRSINFDVVVYDDENKTVPVPNPVTYYSVADTSTFVYPYIQSQNGRIVSPTLPDGIWNVYFFSEDAADNLEVVKSFLILIDRTSPSVNFSYEYSEGILTTSLSSDEVLRCTGALKSEFDTNIQPENNLINETGISFVKSYAVTDGVYFYPYTCLDWVGNEVSGNALIVVDTEGFFYNLQPNGTISQSGGITISMNTRAGANCRYLDADAAETGIFSYADISTYPYNSMTPFTQTGGTQHSSSVVVNSNSIAKKYFVRCVITQSNNVTRSNISAIRFTVDEVAPNTTLYESWGADFTNLPILNLSIWRKQAMAKLKCSDPQSPSVLPSPDYTPREFGCKQLFYCAGLENSCIPKGAAINITPTNQSPLTEIDLFINRTTNLCYYSKDNGNNTEAQTCVMVAIDKAAPNIRVLSVNSTLDGRVRNPQVYVTGVVNNVAYSSNSVEQIADYFRNFNFTATASSPNAAEARFDWRSNDSYDYVMLNFNLNQITYGSKGAATTIASPVTLSPNAPVDLTIEVDPSDSSKALIYVEGTLVGSVSRISSEGRFVLTNNTFTGILIKDASVTSPLKEQNVTVIIDGNSTGQKMLINPDGTFSGVVDLSNLLSKPSLSGTAGFQVSDEAGNIGTVQFAITIDNFGPSAPPRIDPPMDNSLNLPYLENYMRLDYPLYYDNGTYYFGGAPSGGNILGYISGNTSELGVDLQFWADGVNVLNYSEPKNQAYIKLSGHASFKASATSDSGSTEIRAPIGAMDIINSIPGTRYIAFSGHHRTAYGAYGKYYQIADMQSSEGTDVLITLTEPLEKRVEYQELFTASNMQLTSDRFEFPYILPNVEFAESYIQIKQFDDLGNAGTPTDRLHLIVDAFPPNITFASPYTDKDGIGMLPESGKQNGRYVLQNITALIIMVDEKGTGLRNNSINLTINGVRKNPRVSTTYALGRQTIYLINYTPYLPDGDYDIIFNAKDKANNKAEIKDWKVRIDSTLPQAPYFTVTNGVNISYAPDGYTFVSDVPVINVSYPDENIVTIAHARVKNSRNASWLNFVVINCTRLNPVKNIFECIFTVPPENIPLVPADFIFEGDYTAEFTAVKNYSDGTISASVKNYFYFANDVTMPNVTSFTLGRQFMNTQTPLDFSAIINNEDSHYLKLNLSINGNILESDSTPIIDNKISGFVPAEKIFTANLQDGVTYPVNLIATDYGGNTNDLAYANITIDDTAPAFSSDDINVSAQPIYYYHTTIGDTEYFVREDSIQIFGNVPSDTDNLIFSRLNEAGGFTFITSIPRCGQLSALAGQCISNGSFSLQTSSFVTGRVGEFTQNLIKITAVDRADNEFSASKLIYKDVEKPTITICTQSGDCSRVTQETEVITDVNEMKADCTTNLACYNTLISAACKDPVLGTTDTACYQTYILDIGQASFFPLCNNIPISRDDCLKALAIKTQTSSICGNITYTLTQKDCFDRFTGK